MMGPFSPLPVIVQPIYTTIIAPDGGFTPGTPEVGYGQGGYGIGGYDTPTVFVQPAATPNWTAETTK